MNKAELFKIIVMLFITLTATGIVLGDDSLTDTDISYPVSHRSWIKLGIVAYQAAMTPEQIDWAAKNIDWFDSPYTVFLPQYKTKTNAPMLVYDNYYCMYVGYSKYNAMVDYAAVHGLNLEDMFLHFDVDTTITLNGETHTLPAGSRVPSYEWYGTAGDLTKYKARVIMNVSNADYRAFNTQYQLSLVNTQHGGVTYDGIFVDNSAFRVLDNNAGRISAGGTIAEYPGKSRAEAVNAYDDDIVKAFAEVRDAFGPKGAAGSKLQVPNSCYDNWVALFPYIDGVFREFIVQPQNDTVEGVNSYIKRIAASISAGVPSIISITGMGVTNTDMPREKITGLSLYYIAASNMDYFCRQDKNGGDPYVSGWFGALDYNIGQPKADQYTFARGADPSSPKIDSGTAVLTHSGNSYTLTDAAKNWENDYWKGTILLDSANNIIYPVYHSGNNWLLFWLDVAPYPAEGVYQVGTYMYKIYAREFDNALVLVKPKPSWATTEKGDPSATTHDLPAYDTGKGRVSNRYYKLNADGTVDSTVLAQITLRNAEGVILIKADIIHNNSADINQDDKIDILDLQLCVNVVLGSETNPEIVPRADVNGDENADVLDVQTMVNLLLQER